jgi:hypothetical protein
VRGLRVAFFPSLRPCDHLAAACALPACHTEKQIKGLASFDLPIPEAKLTKGEASRLIECYTHVGHAVADIKPMERFAKVLLSALQLEMVVVTDTSGR